MPIVEFRSHNGVVRCRCGLNNICELFSQSYFKVSNIDQTNRITIMAHKLYPRDKSCQMRVQKGDSKYIISQCDSHELITNQVRSIPLTLNKIRTVKGILMEDCRQDSFDYQYFKTIQFHFRISSLTIMCPIRETKNVENPLEVKSVTRLLYITFRVVTLSKMPSL